MTGIFVISLIDDSLNGPKQLSSCQNFAILFAKVDKLAILTIEYLTWDVYFRLGSRDRNHGIGSELLNGEILNGEIF